MYPELSLKETSRPAMLHSPEEILDLNRTGQPLAEINLGGQSFVDSADDSSSEGDDIRKISSLQSDSKKPYQTMPKDTNILLSSFIPPLLALVTLKDAVLAYAFGANSPRTDIEQTADDQSAESVVEDSEFCSVGPCLVDSWPNCWNVSSEFDWTDYQAYTSRCCKDSEPCCNKCHNSRNPTVGHGLLSETSHNPSDVADLTKCCCRIPRSESASWLKGTLTSAIIDLNLRFSTQASYPVLVTT